MRLINYISISKLSDGKLFFWTTSKTYKTVTLKMSQDNLDTNNQKPYSALSKLIKPIMFVLFVIIMISTYSII